MNSLVELEKRLDHIENYLKSRLPQVKAVRAPRLVEVSRAGCENCREYWKWVDIEYFVGVLFTTLDHQMTSQWGDWAEVLYEKLDGSNELRIQCFSMIICFVMLYRCMQVLRSRKIKANFDDIARFDDPYRLVRDLDRRVRYLLETKPPLRESCDESMHAIHKCTARAQPLRVLMYMLDHRWAQTPPDILKDSYATMDPDAFVRYLYVFISKSRVELSSLPRIADYLNTQCMWRLEDDELGRHDIWTLIEYWIQNLENSVDN